MKLTDRYDIVDPDSGEVVATAAEKISTGMKALRLILKKTFLPTKVEVADMNGNVLYYIRKKPGLLRSKVYMFNGNEQLLGSLRSHAISLGGTFDVLGTDEQKMAQIKGNWSGWDFKYTDNDGNELGTISKKWAGLGREFFTNADNYVIAASPALAGNAQMTTLLLLGGLAVDVVFKERQ